MKSPEEVFLTITVMGFIVAFLHSAIPTHWLPFVVAGRAQHWSHAKTLLITALAGISHVAFTTFLGFLLVWLGIVFNERFNHLFSILAGLVLFAFGLFYIVKYFRNKDHGHHDCTHGHSHEIKSPSSDWVAISSLLTMLVFSPCEGFLPIFFSGIKYGWFGFALLSLVLAIGTIAGMVLFTGLTLLGMTKLKLTILEKYEAAILGSILCILGILVITLGH